MESNTDRVTRSFMHTHTCPERRDGSEELTEQQLLAQDLLDVLLAFHRETLAVTETIIELNIMQSLNGVLRITPTTAICHHILCLKWKFRIFACFRSSAVAAKIICSSKNWMCNSLTPSAMRMCSPFLSVLSSTKFLKAVMFSGRVMSPSPSTPPSPGTHRGQVVTKSLLSGDITDKFCERTIIRLKQLARCCKEIFQFEVTGSFQRHAEALGVPASLPQYVLWKASRPCADVPEVQKLALAVLCQSFLHNETAERNLFVSLPVKCLSWSNPSWV